MSEGHKFDPANAERLNDPKRLEMLLPDLLWEALASPSPRIAVDIGAGTGLVTAAFARLAPDARFYAVDVSEQMLDFMRSHLPSDVAGRIEPVLSAEVEVPLPAGSADLVTMIGVYHELDDPEATVREARRLLGEGGRLLVVDWKKGAAGPGFGPSDASRVAAGEIADAMRDAGLHEVQTHDVLEHFSVVTATS
ncbi:MAG TPA: class I SAM-dependent methyltransferase [Coriobacteriia bacterium]